VDVVQPTMDAPAARRRFGVPADAPIVGLMPGSRPQEIRAHLPVMLETARALREARPGIWFLLPVPTEYLARLVEPLVNASDLPVRVVPRCGQRCGRWRPILARPVRPRAPLTMSSQSYRGPGRAHP